MRTSKAELIQHWRDLMGRQQRSGQSVRAFCRNHDVSEHSFYFWRQRLNKKAEPVSFALVETGNTARRQAAAAELEFPGGERLVIHSGADAATLRTVLAVMRERA